MVCHGFCGQQSFLPAAGVLGPRTAFRPCPSVSCSLREISCSKAASSSQRAHRCNQQCQTLHSNIKECHEEKRPPPRPCSAAASRAARRRRRWRSSARASCCRSADTSFVEALRRVWRTEGFRCGRERRVDTRSFQLEALRLRCPLLRPYVKRHAAGSFAAGGWL